MRRLKNYEIEREVGDEPGITFRDRGGIHTVGIKAGNLSEVEIEVFRKDGYTYMLSWNSRIHYVGIEKFLGDTRKGNLFLHTRDAIEYEFGKQGLNLSSIVMAKIFSHYLVDTSTKTEQQQQRKRSRSEEKFSTQGDKKDEVS